MNENKIIIKGAREHNLQNIDVEIPRNSFTVITGLSGSGKSSLAFDTIYAEGQRRYIESLSAYARQFLGMLEKPDVDLIEGLSPAISIEQKTTSGNPRSTVGTVTEIYDYLRLLFARVGSPHCYECGRSVEKQSPEKMLDIISKEFADNRIMILAPVVKGRKGHYRELFQEIFRDGFLRVRVDGEVMEITDGMKLERYKVHNIEIVIDRVKVTPKSLLRISSSLEVALNYGNGNVIISDGINDKLLSRHLSCNYCGISFPELAPNSFSFNSPYGACTACDGLGETMEIEPNLIIPDWSLSINEGAIEALGKPRETWVFNQLRALAEKYGFDFDTPLDKLTKGQIDVLLNGTDEKLQIKYRFSSGDELEYENDFNGLLDYVKRYYEKTTSPKTREWAEQFMTRKVCKVCNGGRLRKESLSVTIAEKTIADITRLPIDKTQRFFNDLTFEGRKRIIAEPILREIKKRIGFLVNVGLQYLTLDRSSRTLSGGESQRIRLASQIGSQLSGALYVLDEPSIGLHQSDNSRLINSLKHLRDMGNTIIVVEHDRETIEEADYVIDLGPRAGEHGGKVCAAASINDLLKLKKYEKSLTVKYLKNQKSIEYLSRRREGTGKSILLKGATGNNLKNVELILPLGKLVVVSGVSGSGKSSLINETLVRILRKKFFRAKVVPLPYKEISGLDNIDKVIEIDQSPIGRTPRSNPATYTGVFTFIREFFTELPDSKIRGYKPGRFSFNVKGGRCEDCQGDGLKKIEMNFLPNVYVTCETCKGKRYNQETLQILYRGKSISDVLEMRVSEALQFFSEHPRIKRKLKALNDVGLGYIKLGQQAVTLSGGEAQRVKLATELSKVSTGKTLYVLDEPTTGLHFEDVRILLEVLNRLVEKGNTVLIIEHNLDVIQAADHIIDLGPGGGEFGGKIIATGTPEEIAINPNSITGNYL